MAIETTTEWNLRRKRERLLRQMQELASENIMRGSLVEVTRRCGYARCVCATKGRKHPGKYWSVNLGGRTQMAYVREEEEPQVRKALENYRRLWKLLDEVTQVNLDLRRGKRRHRGVKGAAS